MITIEKEKLEQWLEALEGMTNKGRIPPTGIVFSKAKAALAAIKAALAQPAHVPLSTMQPLVEVNGVTRFKKNGLVNALYEHGLKTGLGLNELYCMDFSDEDRMQFAQLLGYS